MIVVGSEKYLVDVAPLQRGFDLPVQHRQPGTIPVFAANGPVGTHSHPKVKGPGVVTGRSGTIGAVHYVACDYWPLNTSLFVTDFCGNDPRWVCYLLRSLRLERYCEGTGVPTLNRNVVHKIRVRVPPLREQHRIVARLEQAEGVRRTRRHALELTDTLLPASFRRLFGVNQPQEWPVDLLSGHLEALEGGVNFNPVGENHPASVWRVLKVSAVSSSEFLPEESKPISPTAAFDERLVVRRGDLIMSRANTVELVGAVARVRTPPPKVLLPDKLWRLKFSGSSGLLPDYLLFALRSDRVRHEIEVRASGTSGSMKNISKEDVRELRIPIPPLQLQQKFAALVERVERLRTAQREALRQANHLFDSLLHRAFSI